MKLLTGVVFMVFVFLSGVAGAFSDLDGTNKTAPPTSEEINQMENQAIQMITAGDFENGFALIQNVVRLDPENPARRMNYGSMLFGVGRQLVSAGKTKDAKGYFKESETQLLEATKRFKQADSPANAQCYYLLGDIFFYVHENPTVALGYYRKATTLFPKHGGAKDGLARCEEVLAQKKGNAPNKTDPRNASASFQTDHMLSLRNGEKIQVKLVEKDPKGAWILLDEGTKAYFSNQEISSLTPTQDVSGIK